MNAEVYTCKNGLTVLASRQEAFPLVSLQFWVRTGSVHEEEYLGTGISHLLEHMVFKGTDEYSASALNTEVSRLGGLWNAYTSTNRTVFHIDGPSSHWRAFLHLLVQLVFHPIFPEEEFERERDVIRREMAMYDDDPQSASYSALINTLYKVSPRRLPVIGERHLFDALTYHDMVTYHRRNYVPGNIFLCVAGDICPADLCKAVEAELAGVPFRPMHCVKWEDEPRQWGARLYRREFAQPTSTLMLGWRIPASNHPDIPALSVLSSALGDGRSAWLYKRFHDELGMAHDISASLMPDNKGEGALIIEADVERENRDALREAILAWLTEELPRADFATGLQRAQRQIRAHRLRSLSTVQGIASALAAKWLSTRNLQAAEEWDAALSHVAPDDIARVVSTYFDNSRLIEVSVDPQGTNKPTTEETATARPDRPQLVDLPNGLRLVLRLDKRVPMLHACLFFGAGCASEPVEKAGLSSLLAECLLKGTTTRSASELADTVENLGGSISSQASNNTMSISMRALSEDVETMLSLLADIILHPVFPIDAVETVREDMLADILDEAEDPAQVAFTHLRRACFGSSSYGHTIGGTLESVRSITRDDLVNQHARLCCAKNAVLSLAGDFDMESVIALVSSLFEKMPAGQPVERTATPSQKVGDVRVALGKKQAVLALAVPSLSATDSRLTLQLLLDEWCRDMSGPIYSRIREELGLAYYAASCSLLGVDTGCLFFYLGTAPETLAQARSALEETLHSLAKYGMPAEALEHAKSTMMSAYQVAAQSCAKLAAMSAVDVLLGLSPDHSDHLAERLHEVTPEMMGDFIRELLSSPVRTICEVC